MSLKILLVDGYDYEGWKSLNNANCIDAFEHYAKTLESISSIPLRKSLLIWELICSKADD